MNIPKNKNSGIYRIVCTESNKFYIGSAKSFRQRAQTHRNELQRGNHHSPHFQNAWNKYGEDAFVFEIIEFCKEQECLEHEQWYLDTLTPYDQSIGYNVSKHASNAMGGRNHSEESCRKMSEKRKGIVPVAATAAAAIANRGKPRPKSEETKVKLREAANKRWKNEEEHEKLKETHWTKRDDAAEISARIIENRPQTLTEEHKTKIGASHWSNRPDAEEIKAKMAAKVSATKAVKRAAKYNAQRLTVVRLLARYNSRRIMLGILMKLLQLNGK